MKGKIFKIIFPVLGCITGLLFVWVVAGNFLVLQYEKKIERDFEEYIAKFPYTEYNDSALQLIVLTQQIGLPITATAGSLRMEAYFSHHSNFGANKLGVDTVFSDFSEEVEEDLTNYLDEQMGNSTDTIQKSDRKLYSYLNSKREFIRLIQEHILSNEVPQWERDIGFFVKRHEAALPSMLGNVRFQQVVSFYILEEVLERDVQEVNNMLVVSWKLLESFQRDPYLISHLASYITGRYVLGTMRKSDDLTIQWQTKLLEHDHRDSMINAIYGENFHSFFFAKNFLDYEYEFIYGGSEKALNKRVYQMLKILKPIVYPYISISAMRYYWATKQRIISAKEKENCVDLIEKTGFSSFLRRATHYMLDLELTQKILHVKELAAEQGEWPKLPRTVQSLVCPDLEWVYQVTDDGTDGTMSISLKQVPEWLKENLELGRERGFFLPIHYTDSTLPEHNTIP